MMANRATSMKIDGIRRRQEPAGALSKTVALTPESTMLRTKTPKTVARMRIQLECAEIPVV